MNLMSRNLVLAVVAALLAVPTVLQLTADADTFVDVGRIPLMFQGFTSDNAGAVLLAMPKAEQPEAPAPSDPNQRQRVAYDELLLQESEGAWQIGQIPGQGPGKLVGAPVQKARIESDVFQHLRMIRMDPNTLVQSNASEEQLRKYGLDEAHAYLIRVFSKDRDASSPLAEVYVGDDSSIGRSDTEAVRGVFVRQFGSNDVVLYEWEKPWRRNIETNGWLDPVLARVEPDRVRSLSIKNLSTGRSAFRFVREPGKSMWLAKEGGEDLGAVRQAEIEGLTQRFRYLAVQSYECSLNNAGNWSSYGLGPPAVEVAITVEEGGAQKEIQIAIGERVPGKNEYYMTCSLVPFVMTWSSSMVTPFELDVKSRLFDPK